MLSEPQIQRYARQILLRDVGGVGQEALGATAVRLSGRGPLFDAARTYLQAGGTAVEPVGGDGPWAALTPLLEADPGSWLAVGQAPERLLPPCVVVGERSGTLELWSVGTSTCGECLATLSAGGPGPLEASGPSAIVAGSALALLVQRRLLGLAALLEGLSVGPSGVVERLELPRCSHRPPKLARGALATVLAHLQSTWPEEGCGVLLEGEGGMRFVPLANAQQAQHARDPAAFPRDARRAFTFAPADWLAVLRAADAQGERVCALVHSHPEGPPHFSEEDRRQAAPAGIPLFPGMAHLVVAFRGAAPDKALWALWKNGGFEELACPLPGQK